MSNFLELLTPKIDLGLDLQHPLKLKLFMYLLLHTHLLIYI